MDNMGMRWESVTDNISYKQCVPKPPADAAPLPWDIKVTLNTISDNFSEKVKLGIQQQVGIEANGNWKGENAGNDGKIICWMQGWPGCQVPPLIDFSKAYTVNNTYNYTLSNDEYLANPLFRVQTNRIVTYRTSAGGKKNHVENVPLFDRYLKDIDSGVGFDVPVNINGRIFKFNYTVTMTQKTPT